MPACGWTPPAGRTPFIASIGRIHQQLGGFDGIDLDIEGGPVWPDQLSYIAGQR
jgi:hypothetical protein